MNPRRNPCQRSTGAYLRVKRKNLPIPYEVRLWQSWMILAVSVGWGRAEVLQKITGYQCRLLPLQTQSLQGRKYSRRDLISKQRAPPPGPQVGMLLGYRNSGESRSIIRRLATFLSPQLHRQSKMILSAELQESLERHNTTFETLLGLIPSQYYIPRDEENVASGSKYRKHVKVSKEVSKNAKRAKVR